MPSALLNVISSTGASLRSFSHSFWSAMTRSPAVSAASMRYGMQRVAAEHRDAPVRPRRRSRSRSARPSVSGVTAPVARSMRETCVTRLSSTSASTAVPSGVNRGLVWLIVDAGGRVTAPLVDVDDRERPGRVVDPLVLAGLQVGDALAVRAPGGARLERRVVVRAREAGDRLLRAARARLDDVDVPVEVAVRIGAALRHVGDARAVRRPGRQVLVVAARGQLRRLLARDLEQVQVLAPVRQPAGVVLLEVVAVDDDRLGLLRLLLALRPLGIVRDDREPLRCPATSRSRRRRPGSPSAPRPRRRPRGMTHTCVSASSSPRSERKAIHRPSGLNAGWYSSASGVRVSGRLPLPSQRARQRS